MRNWIELMGTKGDDVIFDADHIIGLLGCYSGTSVFLSTGEIVEVSNDFKEIAEKLNKVEEVLSD